jgi:hypothetical protein
VAGAFIDASIYPMAFNKRTRSFLRHLGASVMVDRVLKLNSQVAYGPVGDRMLVNLNTIQQRWAIGGILRFPIGSSDTAPVIGLRVRYGSLRFKIDKASAPDGAIVDVPNVRYGMVEPGLVAVLPVSRRIALGLGASFLAILTTGDIQLRTEYGAAKVMGIDGEAHVDIGVTSTLFARVAFKLTTVGYSFEGNGVQTTMRDADPAKDVFGARDSFFNGFATVGYLF